MSAFLSKSKYLVGLQCPKLLWTHYNAKEKLPEVDAGTQAIFDQGHEVGELAKQLFPDGIDVEWDQSFKGVLKESQDFLTRRVPLFEAGFLSNSTYARVDVLNPVGEDEWDIIEVKMGCSVKDINLHDVALQRYCYEGAGIKIGDCYLMHINNKYVRKGPVDPDRLFSVQNITAEVEEHYSDVEDNVAEMLKTIALKKCPVVEIGSHCDNPYSCPLKDQCWAHVWEHEDNVFTLPSARGRDWDLFSRGILRNKDIPADYALTNKQARQVSAEKTGTFFVDQSAVSAFLDTLEYPLYFLDFETFGTAVPLLDNAYPYRQIPFQYSVHVVPSIADAPTHHSWIWDGEGDPRLIMLQNLKSILGKSGSVVVYNAGFEKSRIREATQLYPEFRQWTEGILDRIVDLLAPFRSFSVYHPDQHGSASIKCVLPALTGKSYADLDIADGGTASNEYIRVMFGDAEDAERVDVFAQLEEYCGLDTLGMLDILQVLYSLVEAT